MTDYENLVKALRYCSTTKGMVYCNVNCKYGWEERSEGCKDLLMTDAAAAIEALQAENPIVESVVVDKMRQQMEETVCHCNVKENAELIAKIMDDDVDGKAFEMPKRGEIVRCGECKWYGIYEAKQDGTPDKRYSPSVCLREIYAKRRDPDWYCADGERKVQE